MMTATRAAIVLAALSGFATPAGAQEDISGTWRGELEAAPGTRLTIDFVLSRAADGAYTAVLTSPDQGGIKDVPGDSVTFDGGRLVVSVAALGGEYDGTLDDGAFAGEWRQEGARIPLELHRYERTALTEAVRERLLGSWIGKITALNGIELTIVFRFVEDDSGALGGFLDSPDQGATDIPITNLELAGDTLSFDIPEVYGRYTATLDGRRMSGTWSQLGNDLPLEVEHGEYVPDENPITLSDDDMTRLRGLWKAPVGPVEITLRFETTDDGRHWAYLDVPAQRIGGLPLTTASLADDTLTLSIAPIGATMTATVRASELVGTWQQGPQSVPVTFTRQ